MGRREETPEANEEKQRRNEKEGMEGERETEREKIGERKKR